MKKYVTDRIESWNISSNVDTFFAQIEARIEAAGVPRDQINIEIDYEHGYENSVTAYIGISYEREETDLERQQREEQARCAEEWDRRTYERLKAKFKD